MAELTVRLREVRPESPAASTLRMQAVEFPFAYRPGQYIMIDPHQFEELGSEIRQREAERGKPLGPGYFSLSSDATDPSCLEITVKLGDGTGAMLPSFLVRGLAPGRAIRLSGPGGKYHLPEGPPEGVTGFLHLCAGGAVAPNRGMIRHALMREWPQRQLLLVQDRSEGDRLFAREFAELAHRHPDLFRVRHLYSRSHREVLTADRIRSEAAGYIELPGAWAFVSGPNHPRTDGPGFVDRLRGLLAATLGFGPERIRTE